MIRMTNYITNLKLCLSFSKIEGSIVECGTWRGGMIAGIAKVIGQKRNYYLFDSFEGLPQAKEIDGHSAIKWQQEKNSPIYYDNCTASEAEARHAMEKAKISNPTIVKGWFEETLKSVTFDEGIAILRLDGDWYDSTMTVLNHLFEKVNKGGLIIIDDYFAWEGCSKAVHDFLSEKKCNERIQTYHNVCIIKKN